MGRDANALRNNWSAPLATLYWTDIALDRVVKYQQNPLRAVRVLSYLHASMYDAINVAQRAGLSIADQRVAAHITAGGVLELFYPQETEGQFMALAMQISGSIVDMTTPNGAHAQRIAHSVITAARARAANDGADLIWKVADRPAPRPGLWQAAPPLNGYRPLEPLAGRWKPWFLARTADITVPAPMEYGSDAYWAEAQRVFDTFQKLTPTQKKIAEDWHLGQGTVTPAGVWNLKAKEVVSAESLGEYETVRLFALLNTAMYDAFLACWDVKFRYWTERPVTAIRSRIDPDFLPHLVTPSFPSYVSGHATVSGAASEILSAFFPSKRALFAAMAEEAALSRLYGGIHFESDNTEGLALGRKVGQQVIASWANANDDERLRFDRAERKLPRPNPPDTAVVH